MQLKISRNLCVAEAKGDAEMEQNNEAEKMHVICKQISQTYTHTSHKHAVDLNLA